MPAWQGKGGQREPTSLGHESPMGNQEVRLKLGSCQALAQLVTCSLAPLCLTQGGI